MSQQRSLTSRRISSASILKAVITGAGIGFLVISFFVFGIDKPNPEWGQYWRIKPLVLSPLMGAIGGAFFYLTANRIFRGMNNTMAILLGMVAYFVILWLGVVMGLDGTMWD